MALVGLIRRLLALPLLLAGRLLALISPPTSAPLFRAAWWVNGDPQTAVLALQALHRHFGPEPALATATAWMNRRPCPDIAAFAGLLALQHDDPHAADEWLARGRQAGNDALGDLELLEYVLVARTRPGGATELARQLADRRDLPPTLSRLLHEELLWDEMFSAQFDGAQRRARRLLAIQHLPSALAALWAIAEQHGQRGASEDFSRQLAAGLPQPVRLYWQCLGCFAVGRREQAREILADLRDHSEPLASAAIQLLAEKGVAV